MTARVGLTGLLLLAGCAGGAPTQVAQQTPTPTPVLTTSAPAATPTVTSAPSVGPTARVTASASAVPAAGGKDFGYFTAVQSAKAPVRLSFDRALFLTGEAANKAAAEHGDESPVPNDYYVVNDNTTLRTLTLHKDVRVYGSQGLNSFSGEETVEASLRTVEELLEFLGTEAGRQTGFNLVYGAAGTVVRVEEQYQP